MSEIVEYKGENHSLYEWAKITGIGYQTLKVRFDKGDRDEMLFREHNTITCKICGKVFDTKTANRKCCSDECMKENSRRNKKMCDERNKLQPKKKKKKENMLTVTQIAVMAKAAGMSYGQYTALMYAQGRKV